MVLPDLKQLPSLLDTSLQARSQAARLERPRWTATTKRVYDDDFMTEFNEKKLPSWGHSQRLRALYVQFSSHRHRHHEKCDISSMYCLTRTHGRARGGSSRILDAMAAGVPGGSNVTLDYFWLTMMSLAWASYAATLRPDEAPSFGMLKSDGRGFHDRVELPEAHSLDFQDFIQLPHCTKLGALHARRILSTA